MKKIITLICVTLIVCTSFIPANAAETTANADIITEDKFVITEVPAPKGPISQTVTEYYDSKPKIFGDINSSGTIDSYDILCLAKNLAGDEDYPVNKIFGDVNFDGNIDMLDLAILQRHMAEWTDYASLPYGKEVYVSVNDCMPDVLYYEPLPEFSGLEYEKLNANQRQAYKMIEAAAWNISGEYIYANASSINELCLVYYSFRNDHPEIFWFSNSFSYFTYNNKYGIVLEYRYQTKEDLNPYIDRLHNKLQGLVDYIGDTDYNDYELELKIHDWVCKQNEYDYTAAEKRMNNSNFNSWTLYGALVSGKSVCEGYAEAFQFCLSMFGIKATIVKGDNHMWNYVILDGDAYYVDPTWNDDEPVSHKWFNLTYQEIGRDHYFYADYSTSYSVPSGEFNYNIPISTAIKYNYHVQNGTYVTEFDKDIMAEMLRDAIENAYRRGESKVTLELYISENANVTSVDSLYIRDAILDIHWAGNQYWIESYSHTSTGFLPNLNITINIAW